MINNVTIMGRLTATPELKQTNSGKNVTAFDIAIDRRFQKQGKDKETDYINCVAWNNNAEFITRYFEKGSMIAVTGEIQTRYYEGTKGKVKVTEVVVNQASFCGSKSSDKSHDINVSADIDNDIEEIDSGDDLPF